MAMLLVCALLMSSLPAAASLQATILSGGSIRRDKAASSKGSLLRAESSQVSDSSADTIVKVLSLTGEGQMSMEKPEKHQHKVDDVKTEKVLNNENNIKLTATLVSGSRFGGFGSWADSVDPYCKMMLVPTTSGHKQKTERKTEEKEDASDPTWNFEFVTFDYSSGDVLSITCFDHDYTSSDDELGAVNVSLTRGVASSSQTYNLLPTKYRTKKNGQQVPNPASLTVSVAWTECPGDCLSLEATMSQLAEVVYFSPDKQVGNYHLIPDSSFVGGFATADVHSSSDSQEDNVALYKHYNSADCALVFAGSNDLSDWHGNFLTDKIDMCGGKVHEGFGTETKTYFESDAMKKLSGIIASQCGGSAYFVGHSLGGGVATIGAACANSENGVHSILGPGHATDFQAFTAKGLYTFGAPPVSEPAFTSHIDGGCFAGLRAFNLDSQTFDIATESLCNFGYRHPHVAAASLHSDDNNELQKTTYTCSSTDAEEFPWNIGTSGFQWISFQDHMPWIYAERMEVLYPAAAAYPASFNPPWNDNPSQLNDWPKWCAHELNEGCYACENQQGAGTICLAECAAHNCPGFA